MDERFKVHLEKAHHVFSAAHFITFNGDVCEELHGHNYRVKMDVEGPLDENHYVIDFVWLQETVSTILSELDHRTLLPTDHPMIHVRAGDTEVEVTFDGRRWVFPRDECVLLPVPNTTAELLARYIGRRVLDALEKAERKPPALLRVWVDESFGQWGICEMRRA